MLLLSKIYCLNQKSAEEVGVITLENDAELRRTDFCFEKLRNEFGKF